MSEKERKALCLKFAQKKKKPSFVIKKQIEFLQILFIQFLQSTFVLNKEFSERTLESNTKI